MYDSRYNFTLDVIGAPVLRHCNLGKVNNKIDFSGNAPIDSINGPIPYYIVADDAFMLLPNEMRVKGNLTVDQVVFN